MAEIKEDQEIFAGDIVSFIDSKYQVKLGK